MADISHPGKPWQLHQQWTSRLIEEFFQQGDKEREKGLECSPLCDRNNTLIPESQLGEGEAKSERNMSYRSFYPSSIPSPPPSFSSLFLLLLPPSSCLVRVKYSIQWLPSTMM